MQESVQLKRKLSLDDKQSVLKTKMEEWQAKQVQAEKLINEGTERLTVFLKSNNAMDTLASQALLKPRNNLLNNVVLKLIC